ncbi:MAG: response regulator [Pedobacter sp.]|nr:response regulator [Pedobacter sp.]MDQ8051420.1 response regulator [Pedobacter sp.]
MGFRKARIGNIPVILYSAYPQLLWSIHDYGCDEFIAKPFDLDVLTKAIGKLLRRKADFKQFKQMFGKIFNLMPFLNRFRPTAIG